MKGIQTRWETNRPDLNRGQRDCCEIGSGSICSTAEEIRWGERSHQRRVVCTLFSWKCMADLCFHTHAPCLKPQFLRLQRLSKLKNHKGAFWSNISWCFNGTAERQKKLAEFTRSLLLHGCLIKTGLFFFLGDYTPHNYVNVINISKYLIFIFNGLFNFIDANNISICFHWVSYFCIGTSRCNNGSCKIYSNIQSQPCSVWK